MKCFGRWNVKKHKEIEDTDKCVTLNIYEILNISEKSDNLNKMETTSSQSKVELEGSGKGLVTALALKTKARSKNTKRQGMPSEMLVWRTFPTKSNSLKNFQGTLFKKDTQTWTHFELFSSSCVSRRVYDKMRWEQSPGSRRLWIKDDSVIGH